MASFVRSFKALAKLVRPLGAFAGMSGAAALVNRSLRERGPVALDHIGGTRRPWRWRDYEIFVAELGEGSPILLVHGIYAGASSYEYRKLAPLLARHHRVIAFDLLGCGLSAMPPLEYTAELFVEQIVDAIAQLCDEPLTLLGSSLAGAFAIRAAVRAPARVKNLVTIGPLGLGVHDREPRAAQRALGHSFVRPSPAKRPSTGSRRSRPSAFSYATERTRLPRRFRPKSSITITR